MWRDFPDRVVERTGCTAIVYSRRGYGRSEQLNADRKIGYMHYEALLVLPELLEKLGILEPILLGHSDGGSIALVYAGAQHPTKALILLAPHAFVEDLTVESIAAAKTTFETTDLRGKLARYHADVDSTFWGWNRIWLDPEFRRWNIEEFLTGIKCPVLAIQGLEDQYGTLAQLDAIERQIPASIRRLHLENCRHSPHRDQPELALEAVGTFIDELYPF